MRICVTGAAGFIGSVLCARATERGHEVVAVDNLERGLNDVSLLPGLKFVKLDCRGGIKQLGPVDAVVHLAAGTGSLDRPIDLLRELNVAMAVKCYQDALEMRASSFVWPTTSLALGVPDSPYVKSKEEGLVALRGLERAADVLVPLRFFNVVGSYRGFSERRMNEVHIIPEMVRCSRAGEPFRIQGNDYEESLDGTPGRDFVNVRDVTDYILTGIEDRGRLLGPEADGARWLGTGTVVSALDAIYAFNEYVGPLDRAFVPRRAFDCGVVQCPQGPVVKFTKTLHRVPMLATEGIIQEGRTLMEWATNGGRRPGAESWRRIEAGEIA